MNAARHLSRQMGYLRGWSNANQGWSAILFGVFALLFSVVSAVPSSMWGPMVGLSVSGACLGVGFLIATALVPSRPYSDNESASDAGKLHAIRGRREIRVGAIHYPPLLRVNYGRGEEAVSVTGPIGELVSEIATSESWRVRWVPISWGDFFTALREDLVDVVPCLFLTPMRNKVCDFAGFTHRIPVTAICRADDTRVQQESDLLRSDLKIAVVKGESGWEYSVEQLGLGIGHHRFMVIDHTDASQVVELVEKGIVDVAIADAASCRQYLLDRGVHAAGLKDLFRDKPLNVCNCGFMFQKGDPEFAKWFDEAVERVRSRELYRAQDKIALVGWDDIVVPFGTQKRRRSSDL